MDRPWMTALEMQFAALAEQQRGLNRILRNKALPGDYQSSIRRLIETLKHAETYAWSGNTAQAVGMAAKTIPANTGFPLYELHSAGWWYFDQPPHDGLHALAWHHKDEGLWLHVFGMDKPTGGRVPLFIADLLWKRGDSIADFVSRESQAERRISGIDADGYEYETKVQDPPGFYRGLAAFYVAACAWLQQRVVVSSLGHVERHRRKQLAREHNAPIPSDVKVIQLRRTESQPHEPRPDGGDPVDWSCRWIVNGHWRDQPYKDERKLIYILPYVKGPDDKPLKVPTHTVYQVSR